MSRRVAIVQARVGSTRLPRKVLADIAGRTMLEHVVRRAARATLIDAVVVATTTQPEDDDVEQEAERLGVAAYRGSVEDVLDRYVHAARSAGADVVVRITADCPLLDPHVVDLVVAALEQSPEADGAANVVERTFPRGLDVEAFEREALERAAAAAAAPYQREHVTPYLYEHPELFNVVSVRSPVDRSAERWTVDTDADLRFVREVCARLEQPDTASLESVLAVLDANPALRALNAAVVQTDPRAAARPK